MADELDYIKGKVSQEKMSAYVKDSKDLQKKVQLDGMNRQDIASYVAKSVQNMTKDLTLSTKDKQDLIEKVAINTAQNINFTSILDQNKIIDIKQFAKDVTKEMNKSEPKKFNISKSLAAAAGQIGKAMNAALKAPGRIGAAVVQRVTGKDKGPSR